MSTSKRKTATKRDAISDADIEVASEDTTEKVKRRGPGRPPSLPPVPELEIRGIVTTPSNPTNIIELVTGQPGTFKSFFTYIKNVKAQNVSIRFSSTSIVFFTKDHSEKSKIIATIDGSKTNWYYCKSECYVDLRRDLVDNMFSSIDKSFYKCTIIYSSIDPEKLQFIFKDPTIDKECTYYISVTVPPPDNQEMSETEALIEPSYVEANFPVQFTLAAKMFKKSLTDMCKEVGIMTVNKVGESPIQLTFEKTGMEFAEIYRNPDKIKLHSTIKNGTVFQISLQIENIKYLAGAMVADEIRICCRSDGDLLFRTNEENNIMTVNTFTCSIETPSIN